MRVRTGSAAQPCEEQPASVIHTLPGFAGNPQVEEAQRLADQGFSCWPGARAHPCLQRD